MEGLQPRNFAYFHALGHILEILPKKSELCPYTIWNLLQSGNEWIGMWEWQDSEGANIQITFMIFLLNFNIRHRSTAFGQKNNQILLKTDHSSNFH